MDRLTGLLDRWGWTDTAQPLFDQARENGEGLALMLLDLDRFKEINDVLGHLAGDVALRAVATALQEHTRGQDVVGRYGGDEFLLLLPGVKVTVAMRVAERAMNALADTNIEVDTISGTTTRLTGLTASAGLAVLEPVHDTNLTKLMLRADAGLRDAKQRGRGLRGNVVYRPGPPTSLPAAQRHFRLLTGGDAAS
jgi:diguanylate cyclase (GGDEF)-like protein